MIFKAIFLSYFMTVGRTGDNTGADVAQKGQEAFEYAGVTSYKINSTRKSLTLVWVGPVTTRSPSASK